MRLILSLKNNRKVGHFGGTSAWSYTKGRASHVLGKHAVFFFFLRQGLIQVVQAGPGLELTL